jgi:RNA polymerase sigma factor (sigma-70 family)
MDVSHNLTEKGKRDYQLIQRALEEFDQQAYASLLNNYRDAVFFMMLKMTGNHHDAEDLTIEAFGKAFRNLHTYSPEFGFSTWLFRIAANNAIDFQRRNKQNASNVQPLSLTTNNQSTVLIADTNPDPEGIMINEQKIKAMRKVVEKLKPHYRSLIEMRYFDELSYEEIATKKNLPLGTVKAQLFRAREFLANLLEKSKDKI